MMDINNMPYDVEKSLPVYLKDSLDSFLQKYKLYLDGKNNCFDIDIVEFNSDINIAESNGDVSFATAWYLRRKYLKMENYQI